MEININGYLGTVVDQNSKTHHTHTQKLARMK